jgi:DNA-binding NtrC family response regulator
LPFPVEKLLIGEHPAMAKLRAIIERVAPSQVTVLITGESGTGKEVVARVIHALSPSRAQAFVPVNCAAIPHDLLESEMFGHERGAFTGAAGARHGLLATADRGTIFLDEIGEMPRGLQAKLLRVLEDGLVRPGTRPLTAQVPLALNGNGVNLNNLVRELEGRLINDALKQTGGNKQAAARLLGLKRTTFSAKLRRCGVIAAASSDDGEEE